MPKHHSTTSTADKCAAVTAQIIEQLDATSDYEQKLLALDRSPCAATLPLVHLRKMSTLSLIRAPKDFQIDGFPYPGLPMFLRPASMRIEYLPTEYLVYVVVVRGDARSPKTWIAKAYALLPFLNFMDEQGFSISDPTEEQLAHYRNSLEDKGITRDRIARVMNVICEFYEWSHRKGFSKALPFSINTQKVSRRGLLAHVKSTRLTSRSILVPKVRRSRDSRMPHFF